MLQNLPEIYMPTNIKQQGAITLTNQMLPVYHRYKLRILCYLI